MNHEQCISNILVNKMVQTLNKIQSLGFEHFTQRTYDSLNRYMSTYRTTIQHTIKDNSIQSIYHFKKHKKSIEAFFVEYRTFNVK